MKMSKANKNKSTVQGAEPPVPVGSGVPRTGPTRPSSNDCSVPSVGNQAEAHVKSTGMEVDDTETEREYLLAHLAYGAPGIALGDRTAKTMPR